MKNVMIYKIYEGERLQLSTTSKEEANDYMKVIFDHKGIKCEMETIEVTPIDHTKSA